MIPVKLNDFLIGRARSGKVWIKRYCIVKNDSTRGCGHYSDYPLYEFSVETIGL